MVLRDKLIILRQAFFDKVQELTIEFATKFGYPENKGMPLVPTGVGSDGQPYLGFRVYDSDILSVRNVPFPPPPTAQNWAEIALGAIPKVQPLDRLFYESKTDGFYSFYIENYKNLFFLPNWFSEFLQVHFNFCLDITFLEVFREVLFLSIVGFAEIVTIRILLSWIISINPYTFPWNYFVALVDWTEETLIGLVPSIVGVNLSGPILITILGKCADSLNNLVFTMPYLPSEGEPSKALINGEIRDVLAFRYLPILWYKHPIPNEIREYWYNERPDILKYMQKAYKNLNIRFLPDEINEVLPDKINEISPDGIHEISPDGIHEILPDEVHEILPDEVHEILPDEVHEILPDEVHEILPDGIHEVSPDGIHEVSPDGIHEILPDGIHEENIFIPESSVNLEEIINMDHSDIIVNPIKIALNTHINSTIENGISNDKEEFINSIIQLNSNINNQDIFINHESIFDYNITHFSYFANDFIHFSDNFSNFLSNIYC
jgi:hypothetical protein